MFTNPIGGSAIAAAIIYMILFNWRFLFCWLFVVGVYLAISELVCKKLTGSDFAREIGIATFDGPSAPNTIETTVLYCEAARAHVKKLNEANEALSKDDGKTRPKLTFTHIYVKGLAVAMHRVRGAIGRIKFGWFEPSERIGITVLVDS